MATSKKIKAYKVFDKEIKCRGYQFVLGKLHKHEGRVIPCKSGFHACINLIDCFNYKDFHLSIRVFEVELSGEIFQEGDKHAASRIKLLRELAFWEIDEIVNEGELNLGYGNEGNGNKGNDNKGNNNKGNDNKGNNNKGDANKGNCNKGDCNKGNCNEGNYNKGDCNEGDCNKGDDNKGSGNEGNGNKGDNKIS
jgi:hypothetical protein